MGRLHGGEVELGLGEKAVEETEPLLHPFEPGLSPVFTGTASWPVLSLVRLARNRFRCDRTALIQVGVRVRYGGSWQTVCRCRAVISSVIAWLTGGDVPHHGGAAAGWRARGLPSGFCSPLYGGEGAGSARLTHHEAGWIPVLV